MTEETLLRDAAGRVVAVFNEEAANLAATMGWSAGIATTQLRDVVKSKLSTTRTDGLALDGRAVKWRVRVQLQRGERPDVVADTDPGRRLDEPGTEIVHGLPAVAAMVAEICTAYHVGKELRGLDETTLRHALKSVRPALSRRGGEAIWRPRYEVVSHTPGLAEQQPDRPRVEAWVARVDVRREA